MPRSDPRGRVLVLAFYALTRYRTSEATRVGSSTAWLRASDRELISRLRSPPAAACGRQFPTAANNKTCRPGHIIMIFCPETEGPHECDSVRECGESRCALCGVVVGAVASHLRRLFFRF